MSTIQTAFAGWTPALYIATRVRAFLDDRKAYEAAVQACGEAAKVLNWEHEEHTLLGMFDRVVRESCDR